TESMKKRSPSGNSSDMASKKWLLNASPPCQWRTQGEGKANSGWRGLISRSCGVGQCMRPPILLLSMPRLWACRLFRNKVIFSHYSGHIRPVADEQDMSKPLTLHSELVPIAYAEALLQLAGEFGVARERLLSSAGLRAELLHNPTGRLSLADFH